MLKFLVAFFVCSLLIVLAVKGQNGSSIRFGIKTGINLARFNEPKGSYNKFMPAYLFGVSLQKKLSDRVKLDADLLYSRQGNILSQVNNSNDNNTKFKYDYLILPISLGYSFRAFPLSIMAGLQTGLLLKNQYKNPTIDALNVVPYIKKQDYGWHIGSTFELNKHLILEGRYYQSFTSILKTPSQGFPQLGNVPFKDPNNLKNQVITLGLAYYFH